MQTFEASKKEHVVPIILKYLLSNKLFKTAKKLALETKISLMENENCLSDVKLESIIQFYYEYHQSNNQEEVPLKEEPKNELKTKKPTIKTKKIVKKANGVVKKPVTVKTKKKIIKSVPKKKLIKQKPVEQAPEVKEVVKDKEETIVPFLQENNVLKTKKKISKKEKLEKIELKRTKKQENYQQFKEESHVNKVINKNFETKIEKKANFTRCANIKYLKADLFDSKWSNKVKKGGEDGFGLLGFEKLGHTRGKEFRKEKLKLKNREFQGSAITYKNN
jgi:hypothetical protein